jgi:hypothetical protein
MKKSFLVCGILAMTVLIVRAGSGPDRPTPLKLDPAFGPPPLTFIANRGQAAPAALFYAKTRGYTLWLTNGGLVFGWSDGSASKLLFKNASEGAALSPADPTGYRVGYFLGRNESDWTTDIPTSRGVLYRDLYDGIDLKIYGNEREVEYDWIVHPGADPGRIRLAYDGISAAGIDGAGDLVVRTPSGELRHRKPAAYQVIEGRRADVAASFERVGRDEYGIALGAYDRRFNLVIDPLVLASSTYLGGYDDESPYAAAEDETGAIYLSGFTKSTDFPPVKVSRPRYDVFVTKLSADGRSLIYSAFFPCNPNGLPLSGLAVDEKGSVYLVGTTSSRNFPIKNAFQTAMNGYYSAFFLKLTPNGKGLVFSSYLGGSSYDTGIAVALDAAGSFYVAGQTMSPDFPTEKAYQKSYKGGWDVFVSKFAPDGRSLEYSTYLGGAKDELSSGLTVDAAGAAYIAGYVDGAGLPVKNAFQPRYGGGYDDAFIAKLSPDGGRLIYSTYLGGNGKDISDQVAVDAAGAAYLTGYATGSFPLKNAFQKNRKGFWDAFITKVAPDGASLVYSTFLGGAGMDCGSGIAVDGDGKAYVAGLTCSRNFPLKDAYQSGLKGSMDAFLTILAPDGKSLVSSTYLGGSYRDVGNDVTLGADGTILVTGATISLDFPTLKPYQKSLKGGEDVFVVKFKNGS